MHQGESFIDDLKRGEPAAFEALIRTFEEPLYRYFYCDHRDHDCAQEETAETFAQLVQSVQNISGGEEKLRPFVFAIARHVQIRRIRMRNVRSSRLVDGLDVTDGRPTPATIAADKEEVERVLKAIGELEDPLPSVLVLRFVEGMPLDELATVLGMPLGTVKSHIHRGRQRLKELFPKRECET
jgi:RNA polymerase sigma-70 factor (ECF subfamily)